MPITRSPYLRSAFVLDENYITKIYNSFNEFVENTDNIRIEVECSIDNNREFFGLDDLFEFENSKKNAIKSLLVYTRNNDYTKRAYIKLENETLSHNIHYRIEGEEQSVLQLNNSIQEYIDGMKPCYGFISNLDFFKITLGILGFIYIIAIIGIWLGYNDNISKDIPKEETLTTAIIEGWAPLTPFIIGGLLYFFRKKLVPLGQFAIGQGRKRHNDGEIIRIGIVLALIISIIGSLIVKLTLG